MENFKQEPFDLGSFEEIAHNQGNSQRSEAFRIGAEWKFEAGEGNNESQKELYNYNDYVINAEFRQSGAFPYLSLLKINADKISIESSFDKSKKGTLQFQHDGLNLKFDANFSVARPAVNLFDSIQYLILNKIIELTSEKIRNKELDPDEIPSVLESNLIDYHKNLPAIRVMDNLTGGGKGRVPFAIAPVRSKPHRTYDPGTISIDSEGNNFPSLLANLSAGDRHKWEEVRKPLEKFGQDSGLFDELRVKQFGNFEIGPFQIQVRKGTGNSKEPWRNLIDVGYGVSQTLPIVYELIREDHAPLSLIQQPEVHLHPSAQAALGSLACKAASWNHQIVIETHSDKLMDRVIMDVRDGNCDLSMSDITILYFERDGDAARIHSLDFNEYGEIQDPPPNYRRFFLNEVERKLFS